MQAGERQVQHVARQQIRVLARAQAIRQPQDGDAEHADRQRAQATDGVERARQGAGVDAGLDLRDDVLFTSRAKAKRSYSRLMRGTERSTNISAKYCGCSRLNS